jgi:uncharacterized protein
MVIISDTTTITNLWKINKLLILRDLYTEIIIPSAVYTELSNIQSQIDSIDKMDWIRVIRVNDDNLVSSLLDDLDIGEAEAIVLAIEQKADYLIMDEIKGRKIAKTMGLKIIGLLGVLLEAKRRGFLIQVKPVLEDLVQIANFFIQPNLYQEVLRLAGE